MHTRNAYPWYRHEKLMQVPPRDQGFVLRIFSSYQCPGIDLALPQLRLEDAALSTPLMRDL
jgi:hypothetical protein